MNPIVRNLCVQAGVKLVENKTETVAPNKFHGMTVKQIHAPVDRKFTDVNKDKDWKK